MCPQFASSAINEVHWLVEVSAHGKGTFVSKSSIQPVSLEQLYLAYRKAKSDVYFERTQPMAEAFCAYEGNLHQNLETLRNKLIAPEPDWPRSVSFIGTFGYIPKGLKTPVTKTTAKVEPHFSLSDPDQAWEALLRKSKPDKPVVEFRPVAHLTVDMYIVCALWLNIVGHKYDACLEECARGTRLRRFRSSAHGKSKVGDFHKQAPGSFQPYFAAYREWREQGLKAIRRELSEGRKVVALTMDLTAFYHNVDANFLINETFLKKARFQSKNGASLSKRDGEFTKQLVIAFETWASQLPNFDKAGPVGVPVGPSAPRVIANVLLVEFDRLIQKNLSPIYYGRYVDDIFLVLSDKDTFKSAESVLSHLVRRIKPLQYNEDRSELHLDLAYAGKSKLLFRTEKQRVFLLSGGVGEDLLDTIESKIDVVSSEWRLLPDLDDLDRSPAARVLTAAKNSSEDADSLRKADELSLRRLSFSLMLRSVDALERDLPPKEWITERQRFYKFVDRHVLTPLRILDLNDYLPRLLGLAVACRDWSNARSIVAQIDYAVQQLRENTTVSPAKKANQQWLGYCRHLKKSLLEAVVSAYPLTDKVTTKMADRLIDDINAIAAEFEDLVAASCQKRAQEMFWSDLSRVPFKDWLLDGKALPLNDRVFDTGKLPPERKKRSAAIEAFVSTLNVELSSFVPLLFPTRPFTAPEITECEPATVQDMSLLKKYVDALRGTWVKAPSVGDTHVPRKKSLRQPEIIDIGVTSTKISSDRTDELSD